MAQQRTEQNCEEALHAPSRESVTILAQILLVQFTGATWRSGHQYPLSCLRCREKCGRRHRGSEWPKSHWCAIPVLVRRAPALLRICSAANGNAPASSFPCEVAKRTHCEKRRTRMIGAFWTTLWRRKLCTRNPWTPARDVRLRLPGGCGRKRMLLGSRSVAHRLRQSCR